MRPTPGHLHGKPFIFVHIPANAGTAIREAFAETMGAPLPIVIHDLARNHYQRPGVNWKNYYTFSFVRNPFDRLVSIAAKVHQCFHRRLKPDEFRKWVQAGLPKTHVVRSADYRNIGRVQDHEKSPPMTAPQVDYVCDENGNQIVKHIYTVETLQEDFDTLCRALGFAPVPVMRINKSLRMDYHDYYDEETRNLVETVYAADLDRFDYEF